MVMRRAESTHGLSLRATGVHHVGASLELGKTFMHVEIRICRHMLLLLRRRSSAVLIAVEPRTAAHLRLGVWI